MDGWMNGWMDRPCAGAAAGEASKLQWAQGKAERFDALRIKAPKSINKGCEEKFSELNGTQAYAIMRTCTRPCARRAIRN